MDTDLKLYGLLAVSAALELGGDQIANVAVAGADKRFADEVPFGSIVSDPVFRDLFDEFGIDPDTIWYPPGGFKPGDITLNDQVELANKGGVEALRQWLPGERGTERGEVEVELVNGFVEDFFPLVSDPGCEMEYHLGKAEKVLHDLLNEEYDEEWPEDYGEQIAFVENLLQEGE